MFHDRIHLCGLRQRDRRTRPNPRKPEQYMSNSAASATRRYDGVCGVTWQSKAKKKYRRARQRSNVRRGMRDGGNHGSTDRRDDLVRVQGTEGRRRASSDTASGCTTGQHEARNDRRVRSQRKVSRTGEHPTDSPTTATASRITGAGGIHVVNVHHATRKTQTRFSLTTATAS